VQVAAPNSRLQRTSTRSLVRRSDGVVLDLADISFREARIIKSAQGPRCKCQRSSNSALQPRRLTFTVVLRGIVACVAPAMWRPERLSGRTLAA